MSRADTVAGSGWWHEARLPRWCRRGLAALAFYTAIALPVVYVPVLAGEFADGTRLGLLAGVVVCHVATLLAGHGHHTDT